MRVINHPDAIYVFEKTYSILDTLMSVRQGSPTLSPTDFPRGYANIFNEQRCTFLNSAAGYAALAPWQTKTSKLWADVQQDHFAIRTAEWKPSIETHWARSLFSSASATSTTWTMGAATPDAVAMHMDALQMFLAMIMEAVYKAQLIELEKPAGVSLEK